MVNRKPQRGDVLVLVGTAKGGFLFWSDPDRLEWRHSFHHPGWDVYHMVYDPRDGTVYAAANSAGLGGIVQESRDLGQTWSHRDQGMEYPPEAPHQLTRVWHVEPGPASEPGLIYAGVERAGLFRRQTRDGDWEPVDVLNNHPTAESWEPGGGGLCLHTVFFDPEDPTRLYAAVSAGGGYRSDDGGASWQPINRGVRADFLPDPYPPTGQCVHKMALHPKRPHVLFQQNHCGVYRSDDRGDNWVDIGEGLSSDFGFPLALHPHDPETLYLAPQIGSDRRYFPEGRMAVWRSRDSGESWESLTQGLPEESYQGVLREGLAVDPLEPCGVYVGTTGGGLFNSRDQGETWEQLAGYLPAIRSVSTGIVV